MIKICINIKYIIDHHKLISPYIEALAIPKEENEHILTSEVLQFKISY
jgi:hypothetical protein